MIELTMRRDNAMKRRIMRLKVLKVLKVSRVDNKVRVPIPSVTELDDVSAVALALVDLVPVALALVDPAVRVLAALVVPVALVALVLAAPVALAARVLVALVALLTRFVNSIMMLFMTSSHHPLEEVTMMTTLYIPLSIQHTLAAHPVDFAR